MDNCFSARPPHSRHAVGSPFADIGTSFSNLLAQSVQRYSYTGIVASRSHCKNGADPGATAPQER